MNNNPLQIIWWTIFTILLVAGYSIKPRILEDIQLITAFGYDYIDEMYVKGTAVTPISSNEETAPPKNSYFSAKGHTSKNIRQIIQSESPKTLMIGRADVVLYNKELAEHGIGYYIKTLSRDPEIGRNIYLAVVDGSVEKMLKKNYTVSETPSRYLSDLFNSNMNLNLPKTNLHSFLNTYKEEGQDPIMPLLDNYQNKIRIKGVALFKKDKYAGSVSEEDSFLFKTVYENFENGLQEIKLKDGSFLTIENLNSKVKYQMTEGDFSKAEVQISMKGRVADAGRVTFTDPNALHAVEKDFSGVSSKKLNKMMKKFQKLHVDPLGLGEKMRSKTRNFDFKEWKEKYPKMDITVKMDVELSQSGIVD
ncbi:Ger(x)C family spore germination protein [Peribacillus sp. B-H-3]|uniref:Ger(x)C family spore germination protein n=1 Tax=Peribacillus sp. B-H-3 TaxID=3400420 RepID=UPI003B019542